MRPILAVLIACLCGCTRRERTTGHDSATTTEAAAAADIASVRDLGPLLLPCIAKNSITATMLRVSANAHGELVATRSCYGEGHDRACVERVLRSVRLRSGAASATIVLVVTDAGVSEVLFSHELSSPLVFGGAGGRDDCANLHEWMF